jgi:hypothetical protein
MTAPKTYKILMFLKRRPGISAADFRDYYENQHAPLCAKYLAPGVVRYARRFLDPLIDPKTDEPEDLPFDVITELWIPDEAAYRATLKFLATGPLPEDVIEDEEKLFDRPKNRIAGVEIECDSRLPIGS